MMKTFVSFKEGRGAASKRERLGDIGPLGFRTLNKKICTKKKFFGERPLEENNFFLLL
tara:strand:+ start:4314 stop:4487 length:174 start_codon:yes stop_codon:yes gene_type:complete